MPKRFLPNYYEYKKKLRMNEGNKEDECTICLQSIFGAGNRESVRTDGTLEEHLIEEV